MKLITTRYSGTLNSCISYSAWANRYPDFVLWHTGPLAKKKKYGIMCPKAVPLSNPQEKS